MVAIVRAIETSHLKKEYGKKNNRFFALDDINLSVNKGESLAIIGKSGSGKSTLMHLLALLDTPTEGQIEINEIKSTTLKTAQLDKLRNLSFGFVFQQFFLNGNQTVLENVILPLKIAGVGVTERRKRGLAVLKEVELEDKAQSKANDLSGGQKQRAVIARALINNPKIIFADEPTGNLDSTTGSHIQEMLFRLNKEKGITLIIVTHDQDIAAACNRFVEIKDGKIIREG
jgi:putative ABC transport system ATP-binding protein